MDEDAQYGYRMEEPGYITHTTTRPEESITANGHPMVASINEPERRVNPLKIRIGPKIHQNEFGVTTKNWEVTPVSRHAEDPTTQPNVVHKITKNVVKIPPKTIQYSKNDGQMHSETGKRKVVPTQKVITKKLLASDQNQLLGQPTVKFKCRKCSSMSFKSLVMLKDHQLMCKAQSGGGEDDGRLGAGSVKSPPGRVTKKVYLCSSCSTYYENWNLFVHMREVHNRHICLHCLGMFSKAEKLSTHLQGKHNISEQTFQDKNDLQSHFAGPLFLLCVSCDKLCTEKDDISTHSCNLLDKTPIYKKHIESTATQENEDGCKDVDVNGINNQIAPKSFVSESAKLHETLTENVTDKPTLEINPKDREEYSEQQSQLSQSLESSDSSSQQDQSVDTSETSFQEGSPKIEHKLEDVPSLPKNEIGTKSVDTVNTLSHDSDSMSSEASEHLPLQVNSPKHENNNVSNEKVWEGGIKLKLSLNNSSSPVIINSTVKPEEPKPLVRPNRPPGGRIVAPGEPLPLPAPFSRIPATCLNKPENVTTVNRVPKLTVRVPKDLIGKQSSSDESSDSDVSDKLTVDDTPRRQCEETYDKSIDTIQKEEQSEQPQLSPEYKDPENNKSVEETLKQEDTSEKVDVMPAEEQASATELTLDRPLDKYPLKELLKVCLAGTMYYCVFCNHARKIAVNFKQLALHMLEVHRFSATVDSITAEELLPETIGQKIRSSLDEVEQIYANLDTYDSEESIKLLPYVRTYECFQCFYTTTAHKELYLHNRKMHQRTILLCVMCKSNFYNYSELLCHLCPGAYDSDYEVTFRCCICNMDKIPSAFRLMVHLRKLHNACDVCIEACNTQSILSNHVWKHKLHHLCYRCGIAYRNKTDISKHLFWKHGTESVLCKKCLQKKYPHVYHFCTPPTSYTCEECNEHFTKAMCLRVHKRIHSDTFPYPCVENDCGEKFISRKLLSKHLIKHQIFIPQELATQPEIGNICDDNEKPKDRTQQERQNDENEDGSLSKLEPESLEKLTKSKKKKNKDKDSFLVDVNLPALNLSESDSSDESDCGSTYSKHDDAIHPKDETQNEKNEDINEKSKSGEFNTETNGEKEDAQNEDKYEKPKLEKIDIVTNKDEDNIDIVTNKDDDKIDKTLILNQKGDGSNMKHVEKEIGDIGDKQIQETFHENLEKDTVNEESAEKVKIEKDEGNNEIAEDDAKDEKSKFKIDASVDGVKQNLSPNEVSTTEQSKAPKEDKYRIEETSAEDPNNKIQLSDLILSPKIKEDLIDQQALDIWDNFKLYQAEIEKNEDKKEEKPKMSPLTLVRKHVCDSDHDYCLIPIDMNGDISMNDSLVKRSKKRKRQKTCSASSSSSSSNSSTDSCCSRGSKCSCSSSSGSSSSSSSDSDSSNCFRENKRPSKKHLTKRRHSNASNSSAIDVMALGDQPSLVPEKKQDTIPESDLETEESDTDEEFYDKHPQRLANKLHAEKRNQLMLLATVAPSDSSVAGDASRPITPEKVKSPKKKSKSKKKKRSKKIKHGPIKLNIPKDVIGKSVPTISTSLNPNKIKISLNTNKVQIAPSVPGTESMHVQETTRASKRRRVPNKFYGYSSDEETPFKLQLSRQEWRKEDMQHTPKTSHGNSDTSNVTPNTSQFTPNTSHFNKWTPTVSHRYPDYNEPIIRMSTPVPDPVPPPMLMNSESTSDSDSSDDNSLRIDQSNTAYNSIPVPSSYPMSSSSYGSPALSKPTGSRQARGGEQVYCYCQCPYDEVSEMIACDGIGCAIEWFHFECVGIMVPPKGKWYCPDCRQRLGIN